MSTESIGVIGANVDDVTAGTTTNGVGAKFTLGTEFFGPGAILYRYVQAAAAISTTLNEPMALAIDENDQAALLTAALGAAQHRIGWAPRQIIADNSFFWARMRGVFPGRVAVSIAVDAALGLSTGMTAGRVIAQPTTASAGNCKLLGVTIVTASSASASAGNTIRNLIVGWPTVTLV